MKKEFLTKTSIGALLVTIGFFLPWVNFVIFNVSGFELPSAIIRMQKLGNLFGSEDQPENYINYCSYILFLIPIASGNILYCLYSKTEKFLSFSKVAIIFFLVVIVLGYYKAGLDSINSIAIGLYMTIVGCVLVAIDFIKLNYFQISNFNYKINQAYLKWIGMLLGIIFLVLILVVSNPSQSKFEEKTRILVGEKNISYYVKYDDYLLFSTVKMKLTNEYETVGFGFLFNTFITNQNLTSLTNQKQN
jgi:hypothetical protein